ncbi:hypothetical protein ACA910_022045 [Epithemia clementina (nom. ined.)]
MHQTANNKQLKGPKLLTTTTSIGGAMNGGEEDQVDDDRRRYDDKGNIKREDFNEMSNYNENGNDDVRNDSNHYRSTDRGGTTNKNGDNQGSSSGRSVPMRPVFLGNLHNGYTTEDVIAVFERPIVPPSLVEGGKDYGSIGVDRIDLKRGYCFVFLKDADNEADKDRIERFVSAMDGMGVPRVSDSLRAEFARGDGRVKRKEDERRKNIAPSDTLFVVNFNEASTKREDLQCLFEPFGELIRIDMKRNYAFIQFKTIDEATKAKETINGGKLDQSVLTVEYVARPRMDELRGRRDGPRMGGGGGIEGRRRMGGGRGGDRYDDRRRSDGPPPSYRGGGGGPPPSYSGGSGVGVDRYDGRDRRYNDRDRYNGGVGGGYLDDRNRRSRSPLSGYRRRSRSRSRSPPGPGGPPPPPRYGYRDRSPLRGGGRYDDRYRDDFRGGGAGGGVGGGRLSPHVGGGGPPPGIGGGGSGWDGGGRGRSPIPPEDMRGGGGPGDYRSLLDRHDRDRGYRS